MSVQPGLRSSNDIRVGRKIATFQSFFQSGRAKDLSALLYLVVPSPNKCRTTLLPTLHTSVLTKEHQQFKTYFTSSHQWSLNTLRTGDADLRFYITTVQDGLRKSAFLTRACFPCTVHLIMQYIEPVSEWSCWRMFIDTWPHSELTFRLRASSI